MDLGTGLALLGSAKLVEKLLGPTAEYLGGELKDFAKIRTKNINKIFHKAFIKLGDQIEEEGSVSPKILKGIVNEGSFCDDEVTFEYFAGVLASSRSQIVRDDRGAVMLALINRLSSYQIRTHYIFYSVIKSLFEGTDRKMNSFENRKEMMTFLPMEIFIKAMDFTGQEEEILSSLKAHSLFGLSKEDLIENNFTYGTHKYIKERHPKATTGGIIYQPTILGVELFLCAHGYNEKNLYCLLDIDKPCKIEEEIMIPQGYRPLNTL